MKFLKECLTWVGGFFMVMFVLAVIGNMASKSSNPTTNQQSTQNKAPQQASKPVQKKAPAPKTELFPVAVILKAYENNKLQADQRFKDKRIQVSGIVTSIGSDILDQPYITIGTGEPFEVTQMQCMFDAENANQLAQLNKGQKMTVEGQVDGYVMNILLKDCQLN